MKRAKSVDPLKWKYRDNLTNCERLLSIVERRW
uniref:Uncharacterized protein n=1 Tax=Bacteriophage sp. TaxID=38018 RepID=A0A8D9PE77_9VIRU|nr:MAG TPA: hypothetical protein [Bacteriophage sp.]